MSKKPNRDVPGDSVASARQVTQYWFDVGSSIGDLDRYQDREHHDAPTLTEVRIKCDPADELGVLVVVKGITDDGYVICFHRGETIVEALQGASRRVKNHTAKWKEDQYAGGT